MLRQVPQLPFWSYYNRITQNPRFTVLKSLICCHTWTGHQIPHKRNHLFLYTTSTFITLCVDAKFAIILISPPLYSATPHARRKYIIRLQTVQSFFIQLLIILYILTVLGSLLAMIGVETTNHTANFHTLFYYEVHPLSPVASPLPARPPLKGSSLESSLHDNPYSALRKDIWTYSKKSVRRLIQVIIFHWKKHIFICTHL